MALTVARWGLLVGAGCGLLLLGTSGHRTVRRSERESAEGLPPAIRAAMSTRDTLGREIAADRTALFFRTWADSLRNRLPADTGNGLGRLSLRAPSPAESLEFARLDRRFRARVASPALRAGIVFIPDSVVVRLPSGMALSLRSAGGVLLPALLDGRTCLLLATPRTGRTLSRALGPCVYYAEFGPPGPHILAWLEGRRFGPTRVWAAPDSTGPERPADMQGPTVWPGQRLAELAGGGLPPEYFIGMKSIACLRGAQEACAQAVLDSLPPVLHHPWVEGTGYSFGLLLPGLEERLLQDLRDELGPERFRRFWQSPLPVEAAFREASGTPLSEWVRGWVGARSDAFRSGPALAAWSVPVWLLLVALVLAILIRAAERRQVR